MFCFLGHKVCGILAYPPGTEAPTPGLEGKVLTPGLLRNPPIIFFHFYVYIPHKGEIIQYLSLSVWLISLSMTSCSFIHVVCKWQDFIHFSNIPLYVCTTVSSSLSELIYNVVFISFLAAPEAYGILVSQTGIKPASSALEGEVLTTGPSGRSLYHSLFFVVIVVVFGLLFIFN